MERIPMDSEDDLVQIDAQDARDAKAVAFSMSALETLRAKRAHTAARRYRQGQRFFRVYNRNGAKVEVIAIEAKKGKAVVDGKRGLYTVALCDLLPDAR